MKGESYMGTLMKVGEVELWVDLVKEKGAGDDLIELKSFCDGEILKSKLSKILVQFRKGEI